MILVAQQIDAARLAGFVTGLICFLVVYLLISAVIGAIILRIACWLYNKFAGGPKTRESVPSPTFGRAITICLTIALVALGTSFIIGLIVGGAGAALGQNIRSIQAAAQLISLPLTFLISIGILQTMLPTSFSRAALVALLNTAIGIIIFLLVATPLVIAIMTIRRSIP